MYVYDYSETSLSVALVFHWAHTVIPIVLRKGSFWIFFILHCTFWLAAMDGCMEDVKMNWHIAKIVASLTTFFLCFFTSNVYKQYLRLFEGLRLIFSDVFSYSLELRIHCPRESIPMVRLASRYELCSVIVWVGNVRRQIHPVTADEWEDLLRLELLMPEEAAQLENLSRWQASTVLNHWSALVAKEVHEECGTSAAVFLGWLKLLSGIMKGQQMLSDRSLFQIPFAYFHILTIMVVLCLSVWSLNFATGKSIFGPVAFFLIELIYCSCIEVINEMMYPYGRRPGEMDFPCSAWIRSTVRKVTLLIERTTVEGTRFERLKEASAAARLERHKRKIPTIMSPEISERQKQGIDAEEDEDDDDD